MRGESEAACNIKCRCRHFGVVWRCHQLLQDRVCNASATVSHRDVRRLRSGRSACVIARLIQVGRSTVYGEQNLPHSRQLACRTNSTVCFAATPPKGASRSARAKRISPSLALYFPRKIGDRLPLSPWCLIRHHRRPCLHNIWIGQARYHVGPIADVTNSALVQGHIGNCRVRASRSPPPSFAFVVCNSSDGSGKRHIDPTQAA